MCVELKKVEFIYYFAMNKKYLIFGATGSIGSSLSNQMYEEKQDCHLVGRNKEELKEIANKLSYSYSVCDVLKMNFADNLFKDLTETEILGIAYCVGSIDLKPLRITKSKDFVSSYVLNLVAATDIIRTFQDNLKRIGEGFDAANLAKFLLSTNSSWITGQIIGVDGGRGAIA